MDKNFFKLAAKRRSIRHFKKQHIDEKIISEILKPVLIAPTGFNTYPVQFIVVQNKEMIKKIAHCKKIGASPLISADVAIVVIGDIHNELWIEDTSVASSYILLAAEEYNIGACWIHIRNRAGQKTTADEEIRLLLDISNQYSVLNVIALGEKAENKPSYTENNLHYENIHFEKY